MTVRAMQVCQRLGPYIIAGFCINGVEITASVTKDLLLTLMLQPKVSRPVCLGVGHPFRAHDQFSLFFLFLSYNCLVLEVGRPLWREDGSVVCSAITHCSESSRPIIIFYCLIWDSPSLVSQAPVFIFHRKGVSQLYPSPPGHRIPFSSPLTTRRATVQVFEPTSTLGPKI
jgi:hypothetical protein